MMRHLLWSGQRSGEARSSFSRARRLSSKSVRKKGDKIGQVGAQRTAKKNRLTFEVRVGAVLAGLGVGPVGGEVDGGVGLVVLAADLVVALGHRVEGGVEVPSQRCGRHRSNFRFIIFLLFRILPLLFAWPFAVCATSHFPPIEESQNAISGAF